MQRRFRFRLVYTLLALLTFAGFVTGQSRAAARLADRSSMGSHAIHLPLLSRSAATTPPPDAGNPSGTATFWLPREDTDGAGIATNNPQIAVDATGGIHVAYRISARTTDGPWPAFYLHCATSCSDPGQWRRVALSDGVVDVRLQLDPLGHPRLMLKAAVDSQTKELQYAACDGSCDQWASWTVTPITTTYYGEFYVDEHTEHWFALDHAGHPGFLYMDFMNPADHNGTYYAFCQVADAHACTDAANWNERRISQQNLVRGDLVYTQANQARFLTQYSPDDYAVKLAYVECDATCAELRFVELWDTDGYAHWNLRLDHADRPRVALYSGWYVSDIPSRTVFYVWCNATCLDQASWQTRALSPQASAQQQLDMQLDAQDRPRIVFNTSYAWCTTGCESPGGTWQAKVVETSTTLNELYPVPVPSDCTESTWVNGYIPTLALDPEGSPRITYVAQHITSGVHRSDGRSCDGKVDVIWARFSMFPQP